METFYRYEDAHSRGHTETTVDSCSFFVRSPHTTIVCKEFTVIRRTPKGAWISEEPKGYWLVSSKRFMRLDAGRLFAHATKREALQAFLRRKRYQLAQIQYQVDRVTSAIRLATKALEEES